ncbi:hemerythrin domain-containing protein [Bacillus timonensis]|uniref:hemerythrin domain-containing protein n=1 Tax=Bacillus timonensis TaxID=1033734 RepID=UPI000289A53D|nr:hemerythrin domain-containing protein [Bacillus timonensis]
MLIENPNFELRAPLQQLKDEHKLLRADMDQFYGITEEIEFESGPKVIKLFSKLYEEVLAFDEKLKAHSKREEEALFPMMDHHLGENDRTIETMEFEHHKAERHLQDFLEEVAKVGETIDEYDAQMITVYVVQAYATLTQHFAKEETMLFPLAAKILSNEEMGELGRVFQHL